jgi:predicted DNA binding CopG/RHH family protein
MVTFPLNFSDKEHAAIKRRAKEAGLPLYKYIHGVLFPQEPKPKKR